MKTLHGTMINPGQPYHKYNDGMAEYLDELLQHGWFGDEEAGNADEYGHFVRMGKHMLETDGQGFVTHMRFATVALAEEAFAAVQNQMALEFCRQHGWQAVAALGSGSGFAGGRIFWEKLACGCQVLDESDDIRAAY